FRHTRVRILPPQPYTVTAMTTGMNSAPLDRLMVFTGNANPRLAQDVAKHLNLPIGRAIVGKFSDGEVLVELIENVRGKDAFVLQSTCAPTNDNLMELLVMVDALKRTSAAWCGRGRWRSAWSPTWRSSTSGGRRRTSPR